jgi:hypothetical protein
VNLESLSPWLFAGVSAIAAILNATFLIGRAWKNYTALVAIRVEDIELQRIGRGFIFVWSFIVFADLIRVATGIGLLLGHPTALYLLLLTPFGSIWVAVVGLRSFR